MKTKPTVDISREGSLSLRWVKRTYAERKQYLDADYPNPRQRRVTHSSLARGQKFTDVFVISPATGISNIEMALGTGRWGSDQSTVSNKVEMLLF